MNFGSNGMSGKVFEYFTLHISCFCFSPGFERLSRLDLGCCTVGGIPASFNEVLTEMYDEHSFKVRPETKFVVKVFLKELQ